MFFFIIRTCKQLQVNMYLPISVKWNELAFSKTHFCNPGGNLWEEKESVRKNTSPMSMNKSGGNESQKRLPNCHCQSTTLPMPSPLPFNPPGLRNRKWLKVRKTEERKWCRGTWLVRFCCRVQVSETEKEIFLKRSLSAVKSKIRVLQSQTFQEKYFF